VLHQEARQRAVAAAIGIDHFGGDDPVAVDLIDLELLGVAKVLEDLAVCIGNCNFHVCFSFVLLHIRMGIFCFCPAALFAARLLLPAANTVAAAGDDELSAIYKARGDLAPGALIDLLHGGAGNVHLRGALLVRALLEIDKPDDLILIQRQQNGSRLLMSLRAEGVDLRRIADPPASRWSRHSVTSKAVIFGICRL